MKDITKHGVIGQTVAHVYTIEFQKRGLPHMHYLVFFGADNKIETTADVDRIISAESLFGLLILCYLK